MTAIPTTFENLPPCRDSADDARNIFQKVSTKPYKITFKLSGTVLNPHNFQKANV